jgi:hypothetical protein
MVFGLIPALIDLVGNELRKDPPAISIGRLILVD